MSKHVGLGRLLEVQMSKKCTPLWHEAHFELKCTKHLSFGRLLEVQMSKKCTPLWREAHFELKMYKRPQLRIASDDFGSADVEKVHAVVARSTFGSNKCQNTWCWDRFWTLRCRKSAHRCGAKHILSKHVKITACSGHFWTSRCPF